MDWRQDLSPRGATCRDAASGKESTVAQRNPPKDIFDMHASTDLLPLAPEDLAFIRTAAAYLESPPFLLQVTDLIGKPAELLVAALPRPIRALVAGATHRALLRATKVAIGTLPASDGLRSPKAVDRDARRHTVLTAFTGAVGGFFGLAGAVVEIPITTTLMLRSIARIAADSGAPLDDAETGLQCLLVFSLGSQPLEAMDSAYLTTRVGMAMALGKASQWLARASVQEAATAMAKGTAPALARLVSLVAQRFEVLVGQKLALESLPLIGAVTGALLNAAFTSHFNKLARYHFGILRLERTHGVEVVQAAFREACQARKASIR